MALSTQERTALQNSDEGQAKLALLDALSDSNLETLLGSELPMSEEEKQDFRSKRISLLVRLNTAEKVRARINIQGVQAQNINLNSWENYNPFEKQLIRNRARRLYSQGKGFSVPLDVVQALDVSELDDAITDILPLSTPPQRRNFVLAISKY